MPKKKFYSFEKLIEVIQARDTTEAENLIIKMDITELSKVDDNKYTALHWAATYGQEKVCELLMLLITHVTQ